MFYFDYSKGDKSASFGIAVWEILQGYKYYAIRIYKSGWEEAIEATLHHVIENYDPRKGQLENYIISVLKTICLNRFGSNIPDENVEIKVDSKTKKGYDEGSNDYSLADKRLDNTSENIEICKRKMIPVYIKLYGSSSSKTKKGIVVELNLNSVFTDEVISKALKDIKEDYDGILDHLASFKKENLWRRRTVVNITDYFLSSHELEYVMRDTVYLRKKENRKCNFIYRLDIEDAINKFLVIHGSKFSAESLDGTIVWCTIYGDFTLDIEDVRKTINAEMINYLCIKKQVRILGYEEGKLMYISVRNIIPEDIIYVEVGKFRAGIKVKGMIVKEEMG